MNCPKCKNPIADDSKECEWCGVKINKPNTQKNDFNIDEINAQFGNIFGGKLDEEKIKSYDSNFRRNTKTKPENKSNDNWSLLILPALCLLGYILAKIVNYFT